MSDENSTDPDEEYMDGVLKSKTKLTTKQGMEYDILSFLPAARQRDKLIEMLRNKEPLVFPIKNDSNEDEIVIFPFDVVFELRVSRYSQIQATKAKRVLRPGEQ